MPHPDGYPIWYELLTSDADAAQAFYADVIGWSAGPGGVEGVDYRILSTPDGDAVAGLMKSPMPGTPPGWLPYFGVEDVDAIVARIEAAGGAVHMPPATLPGVGRMAMVADPDGAVFYVMRGEGDMPSAAFKRMDETPTPGHAVWNELTAPDQDCAMAFYAPLFGWHIGGAMPMGALGEYKFVHQGDAVLGATMNASDRFPAGWLPSFLVADVDVSVGRVTIGGGQIVQGPDQIPGGAYAVVAQDPQGLRFGFVGPRTSGETA